MTDPISKLIQVKWEEEELPVVDGIVFDNGDVIQVDYMIVHGEASMGVAVQLKGRTTLGEMLDKDADLWTPFTEWSAAVCEERGIRISCGEGACGSEGFIAESRVEDGHVNWIGFFRRSNPFREVRIVDTNAVAESSYGQYWTFPLDDPSHLSLAWTGP